ncbi:TrbI/VirB10 family protein [Xanthomonas sp. 60]
MNEHPIPPNEHVVQDPGKGVRRVNNLPLVIIGGVLVAFVLVIVVVTASKRHAAGNAGPTSNTLAPAPTALAEQIIGNTSAVEVAPDVAMATPPVEDDSALAVPIARVPEQAGPPLPPTEAEDPQLARARALRLQQLQQALAARTGVLEARKNGTSAAPADAAPAASPTPDRRPAGRPNAVGQWAPPSEEGDEPARADNNYQQFAAAGRTNRWQLDSQVEMPRSRFTLRAGFVIPAVMISGVNSDLPGQIIGQVSQDVYDTATGQHRIIPQGTRLVGSYSDDVAYGQRRVLVAWQRLVFPDGRAMDIDSMPGVDGTGYSGMKDKVNNHYARIFGQAILLSGIVAGVELSQRDQSPDATRPDFSSTMSSSLARTLGDAMAQMFRKNLSIAPTLEIRPGFRFNVMVVKDLDFDRPYAPLTY